MFEYQKLFATDFVKLGFPLVALSPAFPRHLLIVPLLVQRFPGQLVLLALGFDLGFQLDYLGLQVQALALHFPHLVLQLEQLAPLQPELFQVLVGVLIVLGGLVQLDKEALL